MRRRATILILGGVLFSSSISSACAGNQAYLDWRPGLTELDFGGLYEVSLDEFERFSAEAANNIGFDRYHGESDPEASAAMAELGEELAAAGDPDPRGYAIVELGGDGRVSLTGARGQTLTGTVDWFAATPDRRRAALLSKTKLTVAIDGASTGIDLGTLIGSALAGHHVMMIVRDEELTVFVLPELGGVVTANEPGYLFAFRHQPGKREAWSVSVARVIIAM
ncbi:MAG TPA: hypothetical protein VK034_06415 [Enhygromyxa sp.]|nr:hypothetical protein [Enhygromyxa sp.]